MFKCILITLIETMPIICATLFLLELVFTGFNPFLFKAVIISIIVSGIKYWRFNDELG